MPKNWMEWLGVIASITTIIAFWIYWRERGKRKYHDTLMVGFLHGIKSFMESAGQKQFVEQINDMLSRLEPPKGRFFAVWLLLVFMVGLIIGWLIYHVYPH
jgi:hypothetical protein